MKNIFSILKKELDKIFKFPRTLFSTLLLPGLLIFAIYAFMGQSLGNMFTETEEHISNIHIINSPDSFKFVDELDVNQYNMTINHSSEEDLDQLNKSIKDGIIDAVIIFDENFDQSVNNRSVPNITILYNQSKNNSNMAFSKIKSLIEIQKNVFLDELDINPNIFTTVERGDIFDDKKAGASILASILPMLIMSFIFGSALSLGADAIAGEKERGTLATLLMAPIKRNEIILGKIISTTLITIFAALSSFVGVIASLPFSKSMFLVDGGTISYSAIEYMGLLGVLLVLSILASSILLVASTLAKTVKEATSYGYPIMLVAIIIPAMTMFSDVTDSFIPYLIPIYNCTLGFKGLLSMEISLLNYFLIIGTSIIYIIIIVSILIKLFKNENVLFSK